MLEIGSLVDGKYKILNKIGQGGMSVVYLAMNERANKQWAIKEVRKDGTQNYEVVKQGLIVETDMLKNLKHPNLPSIIDVIDSGDTFLIVMDYIEGQPLDKVLRHEGAQDQEDVIAWAKQLCDVLGYLHSRPQPIVYRDMKPANVMLKPDGSVMLIDFGTAREFKSGNVADTTCLGTQGYAAPEQFGGQGQTDGRTDIYTLGSTMYHLLTGHNPSEYPYEMYPIRQWDPNLSSGLEEIILRCTQRNPADRYQSCAELLFALDHYNELDIEYKVKQDRRFRFFAACLVLAIACGVLSGGSKLLENKTIRDSYSVYIAEAQASADNAERVSKYIDAINLDPSKSEAYDGLLNDVYKEDGVFTGEEETELRRVIRNQSQGDTQNIDHLKGNPGYAQFVYDLGEAYFFYYDEDGEYTGATVQGNKSASAPWFKEAASVENIDANLKDKATALESIAENYAELGKGGLDGNPKVSYLDFWNDLAALSEGNLVEKYRNPVTALRVYNEIANVVAMHSKELKTADVKMSDIEDELQEIKGRIDSDITQSDSTVNTWKATIQQNIESALNSMRTAYNVGTTVNAEGAVAETATGEGAQ